MVDTLQTLDNAASDLGGRTLSNLPPDMKILASEIQKADRIIFYTRPGVMAHGLTAAEMELIQSNPALRAITTFVLGGLP